MIGQGTICLYTIEGFLLRKRKYDGEKQLKSIINGWELVYRESLERYYIQASPIITDKETLSTRKPMAAHKTHIKQGKINKQPEKFERPKAVYNNIPVYKY
jgi:hypothetical protein